ncbi:MAG: TIGR04282 family arsenosugar biosynthesis glycosyltransferase [Salinibacter sp.]
MSRALLVFAKVPRPGTVKTRLTSLFSPAEAARIYTAFLRDALRQYARLDATVRLYVAPPVPESMSIGQPAAMTLHEQEGADLGARMRHAIDESIEAGYKKLAVIGTDHPTLPSSFIAKGFQALKEESSIAIGPSTDGGFYLLAMTTSFPVLFEGMRYSHAEVFADTLDRAATTDAALTILPEWYDVDTPAALARMLTDLSGASVEAPNTRRVVDTLNVRERLVSAGQQSADPE